MPAYLDEICNPFYSSVKSAETRNFKFGRIFWAHAYYPHQMLELWRPKDVNRKTQTAADFNPTRPPPDAFGRQLPYTFPHLTAHEEFIVMRAKRRPVLLIQLPNPTLADVKNTSMKLNRNLCVVAPIFSVADKVGDAKLPQEFVGRVRSLEFPEFLFLPGSGPLELDSLLRLDELQSVGTVNLTPTDFCLVEEVENVFRSQVSLYFTGLCGKDFLEYRDTLTNWT